MTRRLSALFLALVLTAHADTLTLRNGTSLTGNWYGIDRGIIKFQTNGQVQEFRTSEVASVVFAVEPVSTFAPAPPAPVSPAPASFAPASVEAPAGNLEQQLKSQYQLTTLTADYANFVTMGSTLILQKRGFSPGALSNKLPTKYTYRDGQIKPDAIGATKKAYDRVTGIRDNIPGLKGHGPDTSKASDAAGTWRPFVNGERLYVTQITVQRSDDSIVFDLISDAYPNEGRYKGSLAFQYPGGTLASANIARVQPLIAEVFTIESSPDQTAAPQTSQIRADALLPPDTPPPPPPIAPPAPVTQPAPSPAEINFQPGATIAEVTARLGQPDKVATFGPKKIFQYKDLKVTFVDGRMTDIQ
jgi:hypothetical protein